MRSPVAAAFAIAFGLVILLGYIIPAGTVIGKLDIQILRTWIIDAAVTITAFATLVAILGLLSTHWRKLRARRNPDRYSFFMLAGFVLTFGFGVYAYLISGKTTDFQQVVTAIQVPVETSLMAIVAVTLAIASLRLFQRRRGLLPVVFVISVLLYLLMNSGLLASFTGVPLMGVILSAIQILPIAGGRGILLGIALGSVMAGLRILLGADRPYSG